MASYRFMKRLNSVDRAIVIIREYLHDVLTVESKHIDDNIIGSYSAEEVRADRDVPPINRAVVDGCAALSLDLGGASPESPVILRNVGSLFAGDFREIVLNRGECVEVATGAVLPKNADVVVPAEYLMSIDKDSAGVIKEFNSGYGISLRGEDLKSGEIVLELGDVILEYHIAIVSALGISTLKTWKLPRVSVISTGSEIIEPGQGYVPGKVYDSTRRIVKGFLKRLGFIDIIDYGIIPDDECTIREVLERAMMESDIVITTGGTSVGKRDTTIRVIEEMNPLSFIHGFALTPGRPFGIARMRPSKLVFSLSGMPVAALTELMAVLEPALSMAIGRTKRILPVVKGVLRKKLVTHPGMLNYVRSRLSCGSDGRLYVEPLRLTGSGILSTLRDGPGIIVVPPDITGYNEGDIVDVIIYDIDSLNCIRNTGEAM